MIQFNPFFITVITATSSNTTNTIIIIIIILFFFIRYMIFQLAITDANIRVGSYLSVIFSTNIVALIFSVPSSVVIEAPSM